MKNKLYVTAFAVVFTTLLPFVSYGDVLVSDTFSLNGDDRTAGASLDGTSPEVGSGQYGSVDGYAAVFGSDGGLVYPTDADGNAELDLAGAIGITPPASTPLSFSLTFNYGGTIDGGSYPANYNRMFIAFNDGGSPYGLGAFLDDYGNVILFDTSVSSIGSTTITFSPTETYTLTLNYDPTANAASVDLNGVQVIAPTDVGAHTLGNGTSGVDFFTYQPSATPDLSVSDLEVSTPEPSTIALLMGGLGCVALVARKRLTGLSV